MKKAKSLIIVLIILVLVLFAVITILSKYQNTSPTRLNNKYAGTVLKIKSSQDKDGDGIDDQTDVLESALAYTETRPKYKSKYYSTGYPDDGYGVCTDLVANACLASGYDLKNLVSDDILENKDDYDIEIPDENIDFRRVKNLKVYFKHNAIPLTTNIYDINEWQGGDIVLFENHIGVVSDRRNENGVTYVIHHNDSWQKQFEEDILEVRKDITGHYRISD